MNRTKTKWGVPALAAKKTLLILSLLFAIAALLSPGSAKAQTAAGTSIGNQVAATFTDISSVFLLRTSPRALDPCYDHCPAGCQLDADSQRGQDRLPRVASILSPHPHQLR